MRKGAIQVSLGAIFGALAVVMSFAYIPFPPFGDITPASTPVSVVAVFFPSSGVLAALIKGVGASVWTGDWFMEIPVGVGDALMAALTSFLTTRMTKRNAAVCGQLSRFLFTSGMVALYVSLIVVTGATSPLGGDVLNKFQSYLTKTGLSPFNPTLSPFAWAFTIVWWARFPATALSVLVNSILSVIAIEAVSPLMSKQGGGQRRTPPK